MISAVLSNIRQYCTCTFITKQQINKFKEYIKQRWYIYIHTYYFRSNSNHAMKSGRKSYILKRNRDCKNALSSRISATIKNVII